MEKSGSAGGTQGVLVLESGSFACSIFSPCPPTSKTKSKSNQQLQRLHGAGSTRCHTAGRCPAKVISAFCREGGAGWGRSCLEHREVGPREAAEVEGVPANEGQAEEREYEGRGQGLGRPMSGTRPTEQRPGLRRESFLAAIQREAKRTSGEGRERKWAELRKGDARGKEKRWCTVRCGVGGEALSTSNRSAFLPPSLPPPIR